MFFSIYTKKNDDAHTRNDILTGMALNSGNFHLGWRHDRTPDAFG
jgi:hypothetical protein